MTREEAIKEAYGIPVNKKQHEALQMLIPELMVVDSEDEKIRKDLIKYLESDRDCQPCQDISFYDSSIAWLEKQKENLKSADSISSDCTSDAKCEDQHNEEGDFVFELRQIISSHRYSDIYGEYTNDEEGMASEILELCKCELEKQKEQKPAEWSEEDEKQIAQIERIVKTAGCSKMLQEKIHNWLKSLSPQSKQEQKYYWKPTETDVALFNKAVTTNETLTPAERAQLDIIRSKFGYCRATNCNGIVQPEQKPEAKLTGWVARDRNGEICVYGDYPERISAQQFWFGQGGSRILDQKSFPDLKWEDEPVEVEITIRKR